jgi:ribose transport system permease protein
LQQKGAQSYVEDLFNGAALLLAIIISILAQRRRSNA